MADAALTGLAAIKAKLAKLTPQVDLALQRQLNIEAVDFMAAVGRAARAQGVAPVADALHYRDNAGRVIGVTIISDPKDAEGKDIGSNIEAGHATVGHASKVRALPSFYPTYRARKKAMKARLRKAAKAALVKVWGSGNVG